MSQTIEIKLEQTEWKNTTKGNLKILGTPYGIINSINQNNNTVAYPDTYPTAESNNQTVVNDENYELSIQVPKKKLQDTLTKLNNFKNKFKRDFPGINIDYIKSEDEKNNNNNQNNNNNNNQNNNNNNNNQSNNQSNNNNNQSNNNNNQSNNNNNQSNNNNNQSNNNNNQSNNNNNQSNNNESNNNNNQNNNNNNNQDNNNNENEKDDNRPLNIDSLVKAIQCIWTMFPSRTEKTIVNQRYVNDTSWHYLELYDHEKDQFGICGKVRRFINPLLFPKIYELVFTKNKIPFSKEEINFLSSKNYNHKVSQHNKDFNEDEPDDPLQLFIYRNKKEINKMKEKRKKTKKEPTTNLNHKEINEIIENLSAIKEKLS